MMPETVNICGIPHKVILCEDSFDSDLHLGQIIFTSRFYIEHETSHKIRIIPPDKGEVAFEIESETDLERAVAKILRMKLPKEDPHKKSDADDKAEQESRDGSKASQKEETSDAD